MNTHRSVTPDADRWIDQQGDIMSLRRPSAAKWRGVATFCALLVAAVSFSVSARAQTLPTANQVASNITVGWNLGNTLEAQCGETAWGNPAVTQSFVDAVRQAGFNSIRIPAAWSCHTNPAGSNTIDAAWMARVKQVVDYAYSQGMYVILNIHWDGGWLEEHPLYANQEANNIRQAAFWTQIATTFRDYNERMLFAGTNEVHADYGTPTTEHITVQQSYNQTFVNAVRATGGNNASRTLVVQTYNTNMWHGLNYFTLPTDTIAGRLMVEVHHYDPYDFTLNQSGSCLYWGAQFPTQANCTWADETYHDNLFAQVGDRWVDQGVPVVLGEYGVATRPNLSLESRAFWNEYVNRAARANGIKTYYWDNGVLPSQTNGFAIFNRSTGAVVDQAILDAILRGSGVGDPSQTYTLSTPVNGSGTVSRSPSGSSYSGGTDVTLTAVPASGNQFAGWTGALSGTTNPATVRMLANTTVTANFVPVGTGGTGTILREYWLNVQGTTISSLTSAAGYPSSPTGSEQLTSLEGATNIGDQYGARIRGYLHPLVSGAYTFWLASDDAGDLLLSTNDSAANATRIAYVDSWTDPRQWTKLASQRSASINLVAGQKYYLEVLHKEATGGDHFAVSWSGPGISQGVIGGNFLSPFTTGGTTHYSLSVAKAGTGAGTVTSNTGGINCGGTCSATYASGASVALTAAATSGSTFAGWSGACSGTSTCTVSMTAARSVTATFNTSGTTYALGVTKSGTGSGTVTSNTGGINCGSTCSANIASGTSVTLTAAAASGSTFAGWGGACSGTSTCTVSMTAARSVTATFNAASTFALSVTKAGTGSGTVTSSPSGVNCGSSCSANFSSGASVTLTAAAASGSTFAGWSGACSGSSTCTVSMSVARSVTATFNTASTTTYTASISKAGNGSGTVTSSPAGISCGTLCSFAFNSGASVTLTAAPASGSVFAGWSGACSGSSTTCTVSMTAARAITATFNLSGGTDTCANPVTFSGNSGNFNTTGAVCYRTNATVNGWGCYNFDGRTVSVGGVARTCGQTPLTRAADGYYYFSVSAGQFPWAGMYTW
jgi:endoglucanase